MFLFSNLPIFDFVLVGFIFSLFSNDFIFCFQRQFDDEQTRRDMAQQKEKKLKEEDLKLFEENKKKREELQRYGDELPSV